MRNDKDINLIWKHTHKDFRAYLGEDKAIMYYGEGGTTMGTIENLPEDVYNDRLESAKRKEAK